MIDLMSQTERSEELRELAAEHVRLLALYAGVLERLGGSSPDRAARNRERAEQRKELRKKLRDNEKEIVYVVMDLYGPGLGEEIDLR